MEGNSSLNGLITTNQVLTLAIKRTIVNLLSCADALTKTLINPMWILCWNRFLTTQLHFLLSSIRHPD